MIPLREPDAEEDAVSWAHNHPSPSDKIMSPTSRALTTSKVRRGIFGTWGAAAAAPAALPSSASYAASLGARSAAAAAAAGGSCATTSSSAAARMPSRLATAPVTTSWQLLSEALPEAPCAVPPPAAAAPLPAPAAAAAAASLPPRSPEPRSNLQRLAMRQAYLSGQKEEAAAAAARGGGGGGSAGKARGLALASVNAGGSAGAASRALTDDLMGDFEGISISGSGSGSGGGSSGCASGAAGGCASASGAAGEEEDGMGLIPLQRGIDGSVLPEVRLSLGAGRGAARGSEGGGSGGSGSCGSGSAPPPFSSPAGWETFESGPIGAPLLGGSAASTAAASTVTSPRGITFFR